MLVNIFIMGYLNKVRNTALRSMIVKAIGLKLTFSLVFILKSIRFLTI
jgi:hypothetical protein